MNILVCVKQVPDTTQIKIDPVKHTLILLLTAMHLRQQPALRIKIPIPRS